MKSSYSLLVVAALIAGFLVVRESGPATAFDGEKNEPRAAAIDEKQEDDTEPTELSLFMRKKLNSSNQILEGLVVNDLDLVEQGCDELLKMSEAESWRATNDMMYMQHSREFRNSVKALRQKAKKRAIDGSALAWLDVTLNCIQCHEWVRDTMLADIDPLKFEPQPKP